MIFTSLGFYLTRLRSSNTIEISWMIFQTYKNIDGSNRLFYGIDKRRTQQ